MHSEKCTEKKQTNYSAMKSKYSAAMVSALVFAIAFTVARTQRNAPAVHPTPEVPVEQKLPPLPPGVTELKFSDFFVSPVGPLGLELTDRLLSLNSKRVRMLGYMVRRETGQPGQFLFAAIPVQLHDHDSSDDLPPALVHVSVPTSRGQQVPYAPGLMLLTGTLSVGHQEESDGRNSLVRLALDPPAPESKRFFSRKPVAPKVVQPGRNNSTDQLSAQLHHH